MGQRTRHADISIDEAWQWWEAMSLPAEEQGAAMRVGKRRKKSQAVGTVV
jgi:hypothetical protein